ncbi:MAG: hypothetical protein PHP42_04305 [Bacteroidota bacterium]|nr:hypothetical protein [Bacteroidota bacterium]
MDLDIGTISQLIYIAGLLLIIALTVNNPVWETLGISNRNSAEKKYSAKGYYFS